MQPFNEARMVSLQVPQLLEDFLAKLHSSSASLQSAASVVASLREFCDSNQASLHYAAVAAHYEQYATELAVKGFLSDNFIFFSVPQRDGSSEELFPGGSEVLVTPHNVDQFLSLYRSFKTSKPYRYTDHVEQLPLAPRCHLASDFNPILDLLEKELSKWKLDVSTWNSLGVTFCVPRGGVLVDLVDDGRNTPVKHEDLNKYLELARKATATSHSRQQDFQDFEKYLRAIYFAGKVPGLRALDEESFRMLDVRYCVPIMGKIVDLVPNGQNILVPFHEKDRFCELAVAKLGMKLDGESTSPTDAAAVAELRNNVAVVATSTGTHVVDGLMSPRRYAFNLFAPSRKDALANSLTKVLTNDEILFHFKMVLRQLATGQWSESDIRGLNLFYEIPVNGQLVPLVENGFKISVTMENKDDFVVKALDALHEQSGSSPAQHPVVLPKKGPEENQVLNLFSPSHFEADLFAPYVPSDQLPSSDLNQDEQTFWAMLLALQQGFQPANLENMNLKFALQLQNGGVLELKPGGSSIPVTQENLDEFIAAVHAKKETIHLSFKYNEDMLDPILQFPKERAHLINPVQLSPQDLRAPIFSLVEGLAGNDFTPQDFEAMKLMYCIPFTDTGKVYNLVPDGKNILVTAKYRDDYIQRVVYERDRLQASVSSGESTSKHSMGSSVAKEVLGMRRSITSIPMTDEQITALEEFRGKVKELGETLLDESNWNELGLAWVIRSGNITFDVIPEGSTKHVSFQQRNEFISKCLTKCDEILADQEGRKHVVVPQANSAEMGLFSPTHFTQDLFAPAQHITTKSNLGSSVLHVSTTTPPQTRPQRPATPPTQQLSEGKPSMSPSPPSGPKPQSRSVETLSDFLHRNKVVGVDAALAANGVVTLADLLELQEGDIKEIITAVLPRRRLVEAITSLR
jgi:hypothetical protein